MDHFGGGGSDFLNNLALLHLATGRQAEAEPLLRQVLDIRERCFGAEHPNIAQSLNNLALLLCETGREGQAEPLYRRALTIIEKRLPNHPLLAGMLANHAACLDRLGRGREAAEQRARFGAIPQRREQRVGSGDALPSASPVRATIRGLWIRLTVFVR